jgi:hypothetical protein
VSLPQERKALVERYMIDAEEAQARAQLAAEEEARREATEREARREVAERARRKVAERARRVAEEQLLEATAHVQQEGAGPAANEPVAPAPTADDRAPREPEEDLPVFAWLQRVKPPPTGSDWTRELVRAKEARGDEARSH